MFLLSIRLAWLIVLLNVLAAIALVGFGPPKIVDRETAATIRLTTGELRQWYEAAQPPAVTADALLVYDVEAGRTLYSRSAETPLPPASLTKLMTALLTLESDRLNEEVTVTADDLVGGATMGLRDGEVITVEELLWGLLVASGNDAAMSLARHFGGDVPAFVASMNDRALELGLADTTFVNPNGFDAEGHVSSARNVLSVTLRLLEYPLFREIIGSREAVVGDRLLVNTNELLDLYPGANGVKTGTTAQAGQCLVLSVEEDGRRILIIVLGSDDRYADAVELHDLYRSNYEWAEADADRLSVMNRLYGSHGEVFSLGVDGEPVTVLRHRWGDPPLNGYRELEPVDVDSLESSQSVGAMVWRAGDHVMARNELTVR